MEKPNETLSSLRKKVEKTPTISDVKAIVGEGGITHYPDGTWTADLKGRQVQQWLEVRRPRAQVDAERGAALNAAASHETIRDERGRERRPRVEYADSVGRKFGLSRRSFRIPVWPKGYRARDGRIADGEGGWL